MRQVVLLDDSPSGEWLAPPLSVCSSVSIFCIPSACFVLYFPMSFVLPFWFGRWKYSTNDFSFHPHGESRKLLIPLKTKAAIVIAAFQLRRLGFKRKDHRDAREVLRLKWREEIPVTFVFEWVRRGRTNRNNLPNVATGIMQILDRIGSLTPFKI